MKTFQQLCADEVGTVYEDWHEDGVRCIITRGPAALCAYLGIPLEHPLAGKEYDDIPLSVHGGLTYAGVGDGKYRPKGYFWYGWDYGHAGDASFHGRFIAEDETEWTPDRVKSEVENALWDFTRLMRLAQAIAAPKPLS